MEIARQIKLGRRRHPVYKMRRWSMPPASPPAASRPTCR
jgi:hypothetical protein